ncbi:MAG: hypothetical protein CENE_02803 [Candidatus Celerinatantimonas neptuna]|nr:MAG: hypothetical protein CENE_02803 [Candidatus Celerinatantimonas neptuna]
MEIIDLREEPEHLKTLAKWHHAQWSYLHPDASLNFRIKKMQAYLNEQIIPSTFICKIGQQLVGSAAIVEDDMQTHPSITPWLAALFVTPEFRKRGIGEQLVRHVMQYAKGSGFNTLHLFTDHQQNFYTRLGWSRLYDENYHNCQVTLMNIKLE